MKKTTLFYGILSISTFLLLSGSCEKEPLNPVTETAVAEETADVKVVYTFNGDYADMWKTVDSLERIGLYQSALDLVRTINKAANEQNNASEIVKCAIYTIKYNSYIKEDGLIVAIADLKRISEGADTPLKQIIHSITAEIYWGYYQQNRWRFMNRTHTVNFDNNDIRTWDLKTLLHSVNEEYLRSLQDANALKKQDLLAFRSLLVEVTPEGAELQPTLFDFLANRALNHFTNTESGLTAPVDKFAIDAASFFGSPDEFLSVSTISADTMSHARFATELFKQLTAFHKDDINPAAMIDLELHRIQFMHQYCKQEQKEAWYEQALDRLAQKYSNHPGWAEISYYKAQFLRERGANAKSKDEPFYGDVKRAHELCVDAMRKFPESYGAKHCTNLKEVIESKQISIVTELGYEPEKKGRMLLNYTNVGELHYRIVKADWLEMSNSRLYGEELIAFLLKQETVKQWSTKLTLPDDFQQHSTEVAMSELSLGYYFVLASPDEGFTTQSNAIAYAPFWVSNLSYTQRQNKDGGYSVFVADRMSGKPISGVKATIYESKYNYSSRNYQTKAQESYTSDANGMFTLRARENYRSVYIDLKKGNDHFNSNQQQYLYNYHHDQEPYSSTHFFTDRTIYRPGQTIYFKGIRLRHVGDQHSIETGKKSTVTFYDANYQKVASVDVVTNEYGTFSGSFTAPSGGLNGYMRIEDGFGQHGIRVEEYKRPKFEVTFEPVKGTYKLGEQVKVKGAAKAYAGSNIDGAKVQYRITRQASYPHWAYYRWSYFPTLHGETEIKNGELTTDENGEFTIDFKALADPTVDKKYMPNFTYTITADVTDINGETRSNVQRVTVGYTALNLSFGIPNEIDVADENCYEVSTTNLNGEKTPAKGKIVVTLLEEPDRIYRNPQWARPDIQGFSKEEFRRLFPHDVYENENDVSNWKRVKEVFNSSFDTEKTDSLCLNGIKNWMPGRYVVETTALDAFGTEVKEVKYFTLTNRQLTAFGLKETWSSNPLGTVYEPGQKAEILIASGSEGLTVLCEVEHKGKIEKTEILTLSKEQRILRFPVREDHRGNFTVHLSAVKNGRIHSASYTIIVPFSDKELDVTFETFRDKLLPGSEEEWKLRIKGPKGEKVAAELLVSMYDASLDAFSPNDYYLSPFTYNYSFGSRSSGAFNPVYGQLFQHNWNVYTAVEQRKQIGLNWFGSTFGNVYYGGYDRTYYFYDGAVDMDGGYAMREESEHSPAEPAVLESISVTRSPRGKEYKQDAQVFANAVMDETSGKDKNGEFDNRLSVDIPATGGMQQDLSGIQARTNLNETAFFFPQLQTDANGDVLLKFTMPEALTRWKMLGLAHTKDLKIGTFQKEVVTQKELMVQPNAPRFFREGDRMLFTAKVSNLTEEDLNGNAQLFLFDAATMKPLDAEFGNLKTQISFTAKKGQSAPLAWEISIPEGVSAVTYRVVAKAKNHTDGEEMAVPVLTNRMLVTESMPLPSKGIGTKDFTFEKLLNSVSSSTLRHHSVSLEYTSNPAWYAIQAMPYMMEYPHECAEQTFTRYYSNAIASNIVNSNPRIKDVFESWKQSSPDAFLSNLQKNEELKSVVLEETPWVLDATDESERKKRVALLFDLNKMDNELNKAVRKLEKMQVSNGGWPWFPGMEDSRYITQHIVTGMGHLDHLGVKNVREDRSVWNMVVKGVGYLDARLVEDLNWLKKHAPNYKNERHISQLQIQYLYARSYFKDVEMDERTKEAFNYYKGQAEKYWTQFGLYNQGMIALAEQRYDNPTIAKKVMASIKERALVHEELGMYWKDNVAGYYWYQAPIETHALMIEAFDEVSNDQHTVEELKVWLLKQKQTTDWKTTKATAEACYALLLRGSALLDNTESVEIKINGNVLDPVAQGAVVEAGTGYFKTSWKGSDIKPELGKVTVTRKTEGVSWGAMYWQYFEDLDKITSHETALKLDKQLFLVKNTGSGPVITPVTSATVLKPGDKIKVRIELRTDRNMEYVHMKDHRAAGFEPINVLSRYKWQGELGYYESTRDAATHFFFDYLPKGTHVFEYELRVSHAGDFSNGVTTIQCMYAPEFTSHSKGIRVKVVQ